ncbi:hypothetical protein ANN_18851 [Periplaneta americana]|uniref:Reverse transcriptase domain-containing protein n=1 Tax=Periplaneta americana TaxID=6978 RepID=A0ABQ8SR51_PERAM|nr:hypothetical protein ANN_18851 [Periplaneta americana]
MFRLRDNSRNVGACSDEPTTAAVTLFSLFFMLYGTSLDEGLRYQPDIALSEILLRILNRRLYSKMEEQLEEEQFGFRKGKGTRDAIGLLRTIGKRHMLHVGLKQHTYVKEKLILISFGFQTRVGSTSSAVILENFGDLNVNIKKKIAMLTLLVTDLITGKKTMIGDLKGHSLRCGYTSNNKVGDVTEEFVDSNTMNILYKMKQVNRINCIKNSRDFDALKSGTCIVHGMVILLEQQCSFGKTFSGGGKEYIFQNVLVSFRIKPAIDAFYNARSIVRHPPPTRYAKAPRSFTSVHIALIMSETILTIDTDRTFVITRDGCFVGENYISPIEIHSIGSEGKTVDSLCFPNISICAALRLLIPRFLNLLITVCEEPGKLDAALISLAVRKGSCRTVSNKRASSSNEEIRGRPGIGRFSTSPKFW